MNDGTVMWRSKRRERAEATITRLRPISPWLLLLAVVVIVAVTGPVTFWLYGIAGDDPALRIEAIKNGLTAAAGTGGALALLLAFRRQRSTEIIATETREAEEREHQQRDRAADASERDANERRATELYTKAAEQLESGKAPVRIAGLYALERLAQSDDKFRTVVMDVICAYLRMPFTELVELASSSKVSPEDELARQGWLEERQVRRTAERMIQRHRSPAAADQFWSVEQLDLREAYLNGAELLGVNLVAADFTGAKLRGVNFSGSDLQFARFIGADANGASFINAKLRVAQFHGASLQGARLLNVDLIGAELVGTDMRGADMERDAIQYGLRWTDETQWPSEEVRARAVEMSEAVEAGGMLVRVGVERP